MNVMHTHGMEGAEHTIASPERSQLGDFCRLIPRAHFDNFTKLDSRMPWDPQTPIHKLLHPRHTLAPPALPLRRHPLFLQIFSINSPQYCIKYIRPPFHHWKNRIREVSATVSAKRPRALRRATVKPQRRSFSAGAIRLERFHCRNPGPVIMFNFG